MSSSRRKDMFTQYSDGKRIYPNSGQIWSVLLNFCFKLLVQFFVEFLRINWLPGYLALELKILKAFPINKTTISSSEPFHEQSSLTLTALVSSLVFEALLPCEIRKISSLNFSILIYRLKVFKPLSNIWTFYGPHGTCDIVKKWIKRL